MEHNTQSVLKSLSKLLRVGIATNVSFSELSKALKISKDALNPILDKLDRSASIIQAVMDGHDNFRIILTQKGYDDAQGVVE